MIYFKGLQVDSVTKLQSAFYNELVTVGTHTGYEELDKWMFGLTFKHLCVLTFKAQTAAISTFEFNVKRFNSTKLNKNTNQQIAPIQNHHPPNKKEI